MQPCYCLRLTIPQNASLIGIPTTNSIVVDSQDFSKRGVGNGVRVRVGVPLTRWLCPHPNEPPSAHNPHRTVLHPLAPAAVTAPSNYPTWPFQCYCVARNLFKLHLTDHWNSIHSFIHSCQGLAGRLEQQHSPLVIGQVTTSELENVVMRCLSLIKKSKNMKTN